MALQGVEENILNNSQEIIKDVSLNILNKLKPYLEAGLIIIGLYILYRLIKAFFAWRERIRVKKTYENTEEILNRLGRIETKIDKLEKPKREIKEKPEKKKSK